MTPLFRYFFNNSERFQKSPSLFKDIYKFIIRECYFRIYYKINGFGWKTIVCKNKYNNISKVIIVNLPFERFFCTCSRDCIRHTYSVHIFVAGS